MNATELEKLRKEAREIIQADKTAIAMRSCWNCNSAHKHFLIGDWGKWVLYCFECGHYFYKGVDITT